MDTIKRKLNIETGLMHIALIRKFTIDGIEYGNAVSIVDTPSPMPDEAATCLLSPQLDRWERTIRDRHA